jgi:hypothetical protein
MNSPATARPPDRRRLGLILASVLALLGAFMVTAPAQAGYYGDSYYGGQPCYSHCGYYVPRYRCSSCGCYRRCHSGGVFERRFIEREYIERRYGYGGYHRPYYGDEGYYGDDHPYYGDGEYDGGYRRSYGGYYPYGSYRSWSTRRYPWGWGGVRGWRGPYG